MFPRWTPDVAMGVVVELTGRIPDPELCGRMIKKALLLGSRGVFVALDSTR